MSGAMIVGAGPGLGAAIARRFAAEGCSLSLIARSGGPVEATAAGFNDRGLDAVGLVADATDVESLRTAVQRSIETFGVPDVVVYNAAIIQRDRPGDLTAAQHIQAYAVNVLGALNAATLVAPAMSDRGYGSFIMTGGMPQPDAAYTSLSLGKAAERTLAAILDQQYGDAVHVATVTIAGAIEPDTDFDPDEIADTYWHVHTQPRTDWALDYPYTGRRDR
jgi:NAD(P)-dependent dehydrogenase (short-subunit alcohol dehydrogenase family)